MLNFKHPTLGFIHREVKVGRRPANLPMYASPTVGAPSSPSQDTFLCLAIDTGVLTSRVKMEAAAAREGEAAPVAFPHIFGPIAPLSCVTKQLPVLRGDDGAFLSIQGL